MIDMTQPVLVTRTGLDVMTHAEHQFFTFGKILLLRKKTCIVLVAATQKKVELPLTFPATIDGVTYVVDMPDAPTVAATDKPKRERPAAGGETKIAMCKRIYVEMAGSDKAAIVARFVSEAKCTPAGANTYFITCAKG